jgi:hypothetical protein
MDKVLMYQTTAPVLRANGDTIMTLLSVQCYAQATGNQKANVALYNIADNDSLWADSVSFEESSSWCSNDHFATERFLFPTDINVGVAYGNEDGVVTFLGTHVLESNIAKECATQTIITDPLCSRDGVTDFVPDIFVHVEKLVVGELPTNDRRRKFLIGEYYESYIGHCFAALLADANQWH